MSDMDGGKQVSVILPAAGAGRRFGGPENKIFAPLCGRPVFLRTLEAFADRSDVIQRLMVVSEDDEDDLRRRFGRELEELGVTLVRGGARRSESVRNALDRVEAGAELIAVHDAVRPCVTRAWLDAVFYRAAETSAAMLACPVHGTLKRVDERGVITATVPRDGLWEAQTPQVFAAGVLRIAYAAGDLSAVTDDAGLVEAGGTDVHVVPCDPRNVKITTPADLAFAEAVWPGLAQRCP
jgi:2-C-methyl-D-erythritol 4-phosphate cytidylyltransferase